MPRICAAILLAGIAAAALRPRPRRVACIPVSPAAPADVKVSAERLMLLFGDMPSRAKH